MFFKNDLKNVSIFFTSRNIFLYKQDIYETTNRAIDNLYEFIDADEDILNLY